MKCSGTNSGPHVLHAPERPAHSCTICEPRLTRTPCVSRHNVLDPFAGGQVVAGSSPVSQTKKRFDLRFPLLVGSDSGSVFVLGPVRAQVAAHGSPERVFSSGKAHIVRANARRVRICARRGASESKST